MTISARTLIENGVPRMMEPLAAAQKAANIAVAKGFDAQRVLAAVKAVCLAKGALPVAGEEPELSELMAPLSEALREVFARRVVFTEGQEPAPWRSWVKGDLEAGAVEQMKNACRLPISVGGALMPDAHTGYGLPIGGVLAVRNAVIPYAVGVDIACRMRLSVLDLSLEALEQSEELLRGALIRETRFGAGACYRETEGITHPVMDRALWEAAGPVALSVWKTACMQLATSGGGNHFAEFGTLTVTAPVDEPGFKLAPGQYVALLTHSGSRGAGSTIAKNYSELAMSLHPELPEELRHLAWLELDTPEGQEYWNAMQLMGRYAEANHQLIHERIIRHCGAGVIAAVENHHNFAWKETYGGEELVIHRKGATPAGEGVLGVVPGSMGTPGFVVRGRGNPDSFCSCSHGAGRVMSRAAAFRHLSHERMREILEEKGVKLISGPIDESPEVYKDIEQVIEAQKDLIDVLARFDPKIVKMANEKENRVNKPWLKKSRAPKGKGKAAAEAVPAASDAAASSAAPEAAAPQAGADAA